IRKVLGAGFRSISFLFAEQFFKIAAASFIIAIPMAGLLSSKWLEQFAFRVDLNFHLFATSMLTVVMITISGIITSLIKGSKINPVDMLRSE
ncbi:MAG: ABC transporter permease, partial [Bacteroidota bacterium]